MNTEVKKSIQDYFSDLVVTVKTRFALMKTTFNEEPIHDLRVGLKKFRTLQRLIAYHRENNHLLFGQPLKKIFRLSGAVRDFQVKKNLIENTDGTDHPFYRYLHLLEIQAGMELKKFIDNILPDQVEQTMNKSGPMLKALEKDDLKRKALDFSIEKIQTVQQLYHPEIKREAMHQCRKDLKDGYYTMSMLQTISTLSPYEQKLLEKITELQELYGVWHDWELTLEHLEEFEKIEKEFRSFIGML